MFMRKGRLSFVWTGSVLIEAFFWLFVGCKQEFFWRSLEWKSLMEATKRMCEIVCEILSYRLPAFYLNFTISQVLLVLLSILSQLSS